MKKKVTLRELLGERIVVAVLIALYYWMWARRDWQAYYTTIQNVLVFGTGLFLFLMAGRIRKYKKEAKDELAEQNLRRSDAICLKLALIAIVAIAFAGAVEAISGIVMGYLLVGLLVLISIVRTVVFSIMDVKGV